jgi:UDP-N-acetylmuramoyl-L-alanyl-D-glutamate--2,6-diaminopimelate ligase
MFQETKLDSILRFIKRFIPKSIFNFFAPYYHAGLSLFGAVIYGFPSRQLKVIGVTGTNGKTTVVHILSDILETAGYKTASISSLRFKIGEEEWPNPLKMTMPGRIKIHKFLRQAVEDDVQIVVLEVTSEAIKQHRHEHIDFVGAVMTNISPEHIEAHGSMTAYKASKIKLFEAVARSKSSDTFVAVNLDDETFHEFLRYGAAQVFGYTLVGKKVSKEIKKLKATVAKGRKAKPLNFRLKGKVFKTNVFGAYNVSNIMAAVGTAQALGIKWDIIQRAIENFEMPEGRLEFLIEKPFRVVVDYAHTPDALEKVYETLSPISKKMICVISATGGGRDRWKRSKLGEIAGGYCQKVIVTNEDPYDEDPVQIINEVIGGIKNAERILDRKQAIKRAMILARKGDSVVVTGKGAEPWMVVEGGRKVRWDDREKVREILKELRIDY